MSENESNDFGPDARATVTHIDPATAGNKADELIAAEISKQDAMWGVANERTDSSRGQLLSAGLAQLEASHKAFVTGAPHAFDLPDCYPVGWGGFRNYGSAVANLVVAAAFIRQEIKRRIALGESTARAPRTEPYTGDQPNAV